MYILYLNLNCKKFKFKIQIDRIIIFKILVKKVVAEVFLLFGVEGYLIFLNVELKFHSLLHYKLGVGGRH